MKGGGTLGSKAKLLTSALVAACIPACRSKAAEGGNSETSSHNGWPAFARGQAIVAMDALATNLLTKGQFARIMT